MTRALFARATNIINEDFDKIEEKATWESMFLDSQTFLEIAVDVEHEFKIGKGV